MKRLFASALTVAAISGLSATAAPRQYDLNLQGRIIGANSSLGQGLKLLNLKTELRRAYQIPQQQLTRMKIMSVSVNGVAVGPVDSALSVIAGENESAPVALPNQQAGSSFVVQLFNTPTPTPVGADAEAWLLRSTTQARVYGITLVVDDATGGNPGPNPIPQPNPGPIPPNPIPNPGPNPIPNPNPGPIPPTFAVEANCHIDDDTAFTPNETVIPIKSSSIQGLIADCQAIARARSGSNSSSAILGVRQLLQAYPNQMTAVCHIDDDTGYTVDQFVVGTLVANSVQELLADCQAVARMAFAANSSYGLEQVKPASTILPGSVTATCEMDDDPDFTPGQFVAGTVVGRSVIEVTQTCQQLAVARYATQASSGIKDVRYY